MHERSTTLHTNENSTGCSGQPYLGKAKGDRPHRAARMRSGRPLVNAGILGPHIGDYLGTDGRGLIGVTGGGATAFATIKVMARNRVTAHVLTPPNMICLSVAKVLQCLRLVPATNG
jgi:hypothetical protein